VAVARRWLKRLGWSTNEARRFLVLSAFQSFQPPIAACGQMLQVETYDNLCGKLLLTPG
jgi:hypothetical protein